MADPNLRDLADAVRDLAEAQEYGRQGREAARDEGKLRGEIVVEQIKAHSESVKVSLATTTKALDELRAAKGGAPWWIVGVLLAGNFTTAATVLWLYADSRGQDATEAFDAAGKIVPDIPGVSFGRSSSGEAPQPSEDGAMPSEEEAGTLEPEPEDVP